MGFDNDLDMFDQYAATHAGDEIPRVRPRSSRAAVFGRNADEWDAGWGDGILGLIDSLREAQPWRARAACAGLNPNLFFPERGEPTDEAKAVCRRCPVKVPCGEYALSRPEKTGLWGGMSGGQRRTIRERQRGDAA